MGILKTIGRRTVPVGLALGVTAAAVLATANPANAAAGVMSLDVNIGPSGGGDTLVVTTTNTVFNSTPGTDTFVQFQRKAGAGSACTAERQSEGSGVVNVPTADITYTSNAEIEIVVPAGVVATPGQNSTDYNVCFYDTASGASTDTGATGSSEAYTVVTRLTQSPPAGPQDGGNSITITAPVGSSVFDSAFTVALQVEDPAAPGYCTPAWAATVALANTPAGIVVIPDASANPISANKAMITVPAYIGRVGGLVGGAAFQPSFNVCVYSGTVVAAGSASNAGGNPVMPLVAGSGVQYSVGSQATITTVNPAGGPATGGNRITVVGTGFEDTMTASIGGVALTLDPDDIEPTQFTAVMPARAAGGPFKLSITTSAGTVQSRTPVYEWSNGIETDPNTAPNTKTTRTYVSVVGTNFSSLSFTRATGTTPNGTGGHVYLVKGEYDPRPVAGGSAQSKTNGQVAECVNVLVADDTELVCELWLAGNQTNQALRTGITGCTAATTAATSLAGPANSTSCYFTPEDVGRAIAVTGGTAGAFSPNTVITAVNAAGTTATLSKSPTTATTTATTFSLSDARTLVVGAISDQSADVSVAAAPVQGPFTQADVGKVVVSTLTAGGASLVIPPNTTITAVSTAGVATLSNTPTASASTGDITFTLRRPVPVGVYTMTVVGNGVPNASVSDPTYTQTIITSGSTFTVADY